MRKLSKPIVAVLVTAISAILACLVFAVWLIAAPQKTKAPTRDYVVSFNLGSDYDGTDKANYPAKAYKANTAVTIKFVSAKGTPQENELEVSDPANWGSYTFNGWKIGAAATLYGSDAISGTEHSYSFDGTTDVTFTAQWGTSAGGENVNVDLGEDVSPTEKDNGYITEGALNDQAVKNSFQSAVERASTENGQKIVDLKSTIEAIEENAPSRVGYDDPSWAVKDDSGELHNVGPDGTVTVPDGSTQYTLEPVWTPTQYDVSVKTDHDTEEAPTAKKISLDEETATITLPQLTATGYTNNSWVVGTLFNGGEGNYSQTVSVSDGEGTFELTQRFIKEAQEKGVASAISLFGVRAIASDPTAKLTGLTFTAQWTPIDYTITFDEGTHSGNTAPATLPDEQTVQIGNNIDLSTHSLTGYDFTEWQYKGGTITKEESTYTLGVDLIEAAEEQGGKWTITLTAVWSPIKYTITFADGEHDNATDLSDMPTGDTLTLESGTYITLTAPTITGYNFMGWQFSDGTAYVVPGTNQLILDEALIGKAQKVGSIWTITLTAQWSSIKYTVKYSAGSGVTLDSGAVPTDTATYALDGTTSISVKSMSTTATRKGYTFYKWNFGGDSYSAGETIQLKDAIGYLGDNNTVITFTADWKVAYTVTFNYGAHSSATGPKELIATYENNYQIPAPNAPAAADGYKFTEWKLTSSSGTATPATVQPNVTVTAKANATYTAQWDAYDQRDYWLVGRGRGSLGTNNFTLGQEAFKFTRSSPTSNTYTLSNIMLIAGDILKLSFNSSSWNNGSTQYSFGVDVLYSKGLTSTGTRIFNSIGAGGDAVQSSSETNAQVAEYKGGIYTITLKTKCPDNKTITSAMGASADQIEYITFTRTSDSHEGYWFLGDITNWNNKPCTPIYLTNNFNVLTREENGQTVGISVYIPIVSMNLNKQYKLIWGTYTFSSQTMSPRTWYGTDNVNVKLCSGQEGTYKFTIKGESNSDWTATRAGGF